MSLDLSQFEPYVRGLGHSWSSLGAEVTYRPVTTGRSKNSTAAELETDGWLVSVSLWESGELDLDAARKADGWLVAKHYDLDAVEQLEMVFADTVALIQEGRLPAGAFTSWL